MKRLNIVIPFRARESHLQKFVLTVRAYFARDKFDRNIPYRVLIIEQDNELPFNRGVLKNIGFALGRDESDYTCFHDIDYLPIWADYSYPEVPSVILWYGAESRFVAPGRSSGMIHHNDLASFCGGVLLVPNEMFAQINGYSNAYWGWGYEDMDLRNRFQFSGIEIDHRKGTFEALEHDHEGYELDGSQTAISRVNERIFESRWSAGADNLMQEDGLASVAYEVLDRRPVPEGPMIERPASWEIVTVRLCMQPRREQMVSSANRDEAKTVMAASGPMRISRNAPCPCGSGKKYKHCHGV